MATPTPAPAPKLTPGSDYGGVVDVAVSAPPAAVDHTPPGQIESAVIAVDIATRPTVDDPEFPYEEKIVRDPPTQVWAKNNSSTRYFRGALATIPPGQVGKVKQSELENHPDLLTTAAAPPP
jgi:hypothetical protein